MAFSAIMQVDGGKSVKQMISMVRRVPHSLVSTKSLYVHLVSIYSHVEGYNTEA